MSGLTECHYCRVWKNLNELGGFMAKCCLKRCNRHYCLDCIQEKFNPEFQQNHYKKDTWICFHCQSKCSCEICKDEQLNQLQRKASKRKQSKSKHEQSVDVQSLSNLSLNNSKIPEASKLIENCSFQAFEEMQAQQKQYKNERNIHEKMIIAEDDIIMMPFFMQTVARRKNMFFNFMSRNYSKPQGKTNINDLINKALNNHKEDIDQIDIEPVQ